MFGTWFYYVSFILIAILLVVLWVVYAPDSPWAPWWKTSKEVARAAARLAKITKKDKVYELGSGDGEFVITIGNDIQAETTGIEFDVFRHTAAQTKLLFTPQAKNKVKLIRGNFYDVNLSDATVVYMYLVPGAIKRLMPKLKKELKKGTRLISYRYEIAGLKPVAIDKKYLVYLYKI